MLLAVASCGSHSARVGTAGVGGCSFKANLDSCQHARDLFRRLFGSVWNFVHMQAGTRSCGWSSAFPAGVRQRCTRMFAAGCCLAVTIGLVGCRNSIKVVNPNVSQTGSNWRSPNAGVTSPVNLVLQFDSSAVVNNSNFAVELHSVTTPTGGSPQCGPLIQNLAPQLQPQPVPGGSSSTTITVANDYCLRLHADLTSSRPFDSTGFDYYFRVNASTSGGSPPPGTSPGFSLSANPSNGSVVWGNRSPNFAISAQGSGGFNQQITLTATGTPAGGGPPSFSLNPITSGQSSNLTMGTTIARTRLGASQIVVSGMSGGLSAQTMVTLNVLPLDGAFTEVVPISSNRVCGNVAALYDTSQVNNFTVDFQVYPGPAPQGAPLPVNHLPSGAVQTMPPPQESFYAISPNCRVGLVMPGLQSSPQPQVNVYNLGFSPATSAVGGIPQQAGSNIINWLWRRFYFSADDSLFYSVARLQGNIGMPGPHVGNLRNVITGHDTQCGFQFVPNVTAVRATEDSTDFLPDIQSVTLGGGTVTVTYRDRNGQSQSFPCPAP